MSNPKPQAQFDRQWYTPPNSFYPTQPIGEVSYENGTIRGVRKYDPAQNSFVNYSYTTPDQYARQQQSQKGLLNTLNTVNNLFNDLPGQMDTYRQNLAAPQERALDRGYQKALNFDLARANSQGGMQNSLGFAKYKANELDRNLAEGYADIANQSYLQSFQLPQMMLAPYQDLFNMYSASLAGEQANTDFNLNSMLGGTAASQGAFNAMNQFSRPQLLGPTNYYQKQGFLGGLF